MAVSLVVGLLAPLAALVFSIRAARAGHPRGWLLVATTGVILALLAAFPIVTTLASQAPPDLGGESQSSDWSVWFMGVGPPPPSSNGVEEYTADAPQPVVEADGRVNSVQMTWRTRHTPSQACADFRIGMRFMVGTVSDSPAGPGEACRLSADAGRVTAVVTPASPDASGAVIVTTEKRPSDPVP